MWDDRFLFVISAFIAIAIILGRRVARLQESKSIGPLEITLRSVIFVATVFIFILILGGYIWNHWHETFLPTFLPNVTSLVAILFGALFGAFTGRFVSSLFSARFGRRDPLVGAGVLLALSIAYSLPLYSGAISELISGIGLSSVKTPFLELTVRERGSSTITGAAGGSSSNSGEVPRTSSPTPGLKWLNLDTDNIDPDSTLPSDEGYIRFFDNDIFSSDDHKQDVEQIERFLSPAKTLSTCLHEYVKVFPDSGLLLVDIKPVIESMFMLHARAIQDLTSNPPKTDLNYTSYGASHFGTEVNDVLGQVNDKFAASKNPEVKPENLSIECKSRDSGAAGVFTIDHRQPYSTLVLADLLHAHGSPDEAIAVLAEWLSASDAYREKNQKDAEKISKWWQLRIMSRIALLMLEVAGQNNLAYRDFFDSYKRDLESYFEKKNVALDQIHTKCKDWQELRDNQYRGVGSASSAPAQVDVRIEQKAFYVLLEAEDESLRTEVNFIGDEGKVERLENLHDRAVFLASIDGECLPEYFSPELRKGTIADHQVTAGLVDLTVADRMALVALSRRDRERSAEIAQAGEKALREGYATLSSLAEDERQKIQAKPWDKRVFAQPNWEKSVSLAAQAFLRLRSRPD